MKNYKVVVSKGVRVEYNIKALNYDHAVKIVISREPDCAIWSIEKI